MPVAGLIIRQREPLNLESPFGEIDSFLTPTELFYIRSHFKVPQMKADSYQLEIDGAVRERKAFSYRELRNMPAESCTATLECAGNGRVFLVPQEEGAQWELGAVGNAEWTGVRLSTLLEHGGLEEGVCEIVFEGADRGKAKEKPTPPGEISYVRSLAIEKAMQPEVLIAYQMNGRDLPPEHGFPVRAVVPGHYGMASVKWLHRITAVTKPFSGYWQTSDYGYWDYVNGQPVRVPLGKMRVKSQIARPAVYEVLPPGCVYTVEGAAWAGESDVVEVGVSTDNGETWAQADLIDPVCRHAWRRWRFAWRTPEKSGSYVLKACAKTSCGEAQPERHDPIYGSYVINQPLPIEVFVGDK